MKLHPLEDRIVVRAGEPEETTISGLVIPDTAKEKPQQGEVLAVGPGRRAEHSGELIPLDLAVGDTVVSSQGVVTAAPAFTISAAEVITDRTDHRRPPSVDCRRRDRLPVFPHA